MSEPLVRFGEKVVVSSDDTTKINWIFFGSLATGATILAIIVAIAITKIG